MDVAEVGKLFRRRDFDGPATCQALLPASLSDGLRASQSSS
jgi:hypothetical protein